MHIQAKEDYHTRSYIDIQLLNIRVIKKSLNNQL